MPRGFFHKSKVMAKKAPTSLVPKCGACGLFAACNSPKLTPEGDGKKRILLITEMPDSEEDSKGRYAVGKAGKYLELALQRVGIKLQRDCVITSALICHPKETLPNADQIDYCRPNVLKAIDTHKPEVIIPLGTAAVQSVLANVYKEDDIGGVMRWSGFVIPSQKLNAWICPTFSPHFVIREEDKKSKNPVPAKLFHHHLAKAAKLQGRPWDPVPNYNAEIERIVNPADAAAAIVKLIRSGDPLAFDYETTCLKPEYEGAAIVSCSVSNGERTIAYPWIGKAIEATELMIRSDNPKIACNLKFEERWTRWFFKRRVRNWAWDTMNAAHVLDNRPNTTSIKFQAFAHVGTEAYDEHIKPFLKAKRGKRTNQILQEIDLDQLLLYNGLDSLLEWHVAMRQAKIAGMEI